MKKKLLLILFLISTLSFVDALATQFALTESGTCHIGWPFADGSSYASKNGWNVVSGSAFHTGADQYADDWNWGSGNADLGKPLIAVMPGEVIYVQKNVSNAQKSNCNSTNFGNQVIIRYGTYAVRYAHLQYVSANIYVGATVAVGANIGTVGHSGLGGICVGSTCCTAHLHLVLYMNIDNNSTALNNLNTGALPPSTCKVPFYSDATSGFPSNTGTCNPPTTTQTSVTNISTTSAKFNCTVSGVAEYDWQYRKQGVSTWTGVTATATNNKTITGLLSNTNYEFQVAVKCGTTYSNWSPSKAFKTL